MRTLTSLAAAAAAAVLLLLAGCNKSGPKTAWVEVEPGLSYVDSSLGSGDVVGPRDLVLVDYTGWYEFDDDDLYETESDSLVKFDSSVERGEPLAVALGRNRVIRGWDDGLPGMAVGGKRRLRIAPDLGYGAQGRPPYIPGGATLVFDVKVLRKIQLEVAVDEAGDGPVAEPGDRVSVAYTGWLWENGAKGKEFDSSIPRGRPYQFTLGAGQVIRGWDFGLEGLAKGTKAHLVIPPELAYGATGSGGTIPPRATLYFEVELVDVQKP